MIWDALNTLMAWLCQTIYPLIAYAYDLFYDVGQLRIINDDKISPIYERITLILGLVMLFVVIFQLIRYIMEPDNFTDKEKGFGKVMFRMITSIILIAFVPKIFDFAFEIQKDIMDNNLIPKIIIGEGEIDKNWGRILSASILEKTYYVNPNLNNPICDEPKNTSAQSIVQANISDLRENGRLGNSLQLCINERDKKNEQENKIHFDGIIAIVGGGLVLWMLAMYTLDLGVRVVQLTYLQIIAPIPIIMYILPKKDGAFEKWVKQCTTTFLDLFLRTAIICLTVLIISELSESTIVGIASDKGGFHTALLYIILILGVMTFAKKAGDMLKELFPKGNAASGELGLSTKNRIPEPAKRIAGAGIGIAAAGTVGLARRTWGNHKYSKQGKEEKAVLQRRLSDVQRNYNAQNAIANDNTKSATERSEARQRANQYKTEIEQIKQQQKRTNWKYNKARMAVATAGGVLVDANKGMVAGLTTKGGIGGVAKSTKSVLKANSALDEWRQNGGTSSVSRVVSGVQQSLGINPTERFEKRKERLEKENKVLGNFTEYFGKTKETIEKDIEDGKCDKVGSKSRKYRIAKIKAETLAAQAGNLKLSDFRYQTTEARNAGRANILTTINNARKRSFDGELNVEDVKMKRIMERADELCKAYGFGTTLDDIKPSPIVGEPKKHGKEKLSTVNNAAPMPTVVEAQKSGKESVASSNVAEHIENAQESIEREKTSTVNNAATMPTDEEIQKLQEEQLEKEKLDKLNMILDQIAEEMAREEYNAEVERLQQETSDAQSEVVKLKKDAVKEVGEAIMRGETGDYNNDKAAQYIKMMQNTVNVASNDVDILTGAELTTYANLDDLNKAADARRRDNTDELDTMQQSAEYKAAQANKKYNENGKS